MPGELGAQGVAQCARAVAVDDGYPLRAGDRRLIDVPVEHLERLLDPGAADVQRRGHTTRRRRHMARTTPGRLGRARVLPTHLAAPPRARPGGDRLELVERRRDT